MVRALEAESIGVASPNYVYRHRPGHRRPTRRARRGSPEQYVVEKLQLAEVHKVATGSDVLVAVINSEIDAKHPDLAGAIVEQFDAVGTPEQAALARHRHGRRDRAHTQAARHRAERAASWRSTPSRPRRRQSPEATTRQIIAGIEWAINKGARVINMSFAGPYDPMLQLAMKNAHAKGVVLIAASGNMGAKSPPLYPAADPHVIAVTATDESDKLFAQAVRGPHVAVAAPGVDVMVPAPDDTYQLTTGTSVAAAHVSGVAALLLERHPTVERRTVLEVLTSTARKLNPKGRDDQFGWGLIDPAAALQELDSRIADGKADRHRQAGAPEAAAAKRSSTEDTRRRRPRRQAPAAIGARDLRRTARRVARARAGIVVPPCPHTAPNTSQQLVGHTMSIRPVKRIVQSKPTMEGAGVKLRRAFGFGDTERVRSVPAVRRFPQRSPGRLSRRLSRGIRIAASRPSPTCSPAPSSTATASATAARSAPATCSG